MASKRFFVLLAFGFTYIFVHRYNSLSKKTSNALYNLQEQSLAQDRLADNRMTIILQPKANGNNNVLAVGSDDLLDNALANDEVSYVKNFSIPSETVDPDSAFFANIYKDAYGLPIRGPGLYTYEKPDYNWTQYFPTVMSSLTSLRKIQQIDPITDPMSFTSKRSTVEIDVKESYRVGDVLVAHIQAKNILGEDKVLGGDYFRARLIQKDLFGKIIDGIACKIEDHMNGKYTLRVPLLFEGRMTLEVKLVLPLEGIAFYFDYTSMRNHKGNYFNATLQTNETVECNMDLNNFEKYDNKPTCDYGNPRTGDTWFCAVPPSGKCHPITWMIAEKMFRVSPFDYRGRVRRLFGNIVKIRGSGIQIEILAETDEAQIEEKKSTITSSAPFTYLQQEQWIPTQHSMHCHDLRSCSECFSNKRIYFIGDSTIRQFFYLSVTKFRLEMHGPDHSRIWQQPKVAWSTDSSRNIRIYYRAHGPPLRNPGPPNTRPYLSDFLGVVPGGPEVYIVFNVGLHFLEYETSVYLRRLVLIKDAILQHQQAFPGTKFILRGMNVVEWPQEWLIFRQEVILREVFKNIPNLFYFDLWDFTTVLPLNDYHPSRPVLENQVLLFHNLLCDM
ncbi:unnamed protein product [Clavelina lepadiformis]|uniref:NXPE C-terminal domain-containing protein n=1 Tax=Clavelina lepadiformis TaxID=159417 RepID=A0ABP0FYZ6_CLALP